MSKSKDSRGEWIRRKETRLEKRDYSEDGIYFVTVCVKDKHRILWTYESCVFDELTSPETPVFYTERGKAVKKAVLGIETAYPAVKVAEYSIMPDHLHLLLIFRSGMDKSGRAMRAPTLSTLINQFKGAVTKEIGYSIWQKLFYDRIIRNQKEYAACVEYIRRNPYEYRKKHFGR